MSTAEQRLHASQTAVTVGLLTKAFDAMTAGVRKLLIERDQRIKLLEQRIASLERQLAGADS